MRVDPQTIDPVVAERLLKVAYELEVALASIVDQVEDTFSPELSVKFRHVVGHVLGEFNDTFLLAVIEKYPDLSRSAGLID